MITDAQIEMLLLLLWLYYKNPDLGEKFRKHRAYAEAILNNWIKPESKPPKNFKLCAAALKAKLEAFNWGVAEEEEPTQGRTPSKKRKAAAISGNGGEGSSTSNASGVFTNAPANHRIFGTNGIMRHIHVSKGGRSKSRRVAPGYASPRYTVFGDNGLTVGDCFAYQIAAVRDGAHEDSIKEISGSARHGAFSIIVSGRYADIDYDTGDTVFYAAADAHETKAATADRNNKGNQALLKSLETRNPIRVLRKSTSEWAGRPEAGLRHDGSYTCTACAERTNSEIEKYRRFRLQGVQGQLPIAVNRPIPAELRDIKAAKLGY